MIDSLKYNRSVFLSPKEINLFLFGIFFKVSNGPFRCLYRLDPAESSLPHLTFADVSSTEWVCSPSSTPR